jgi:hypothetical protein
MLDTCKLIPEDIKLGDDTESFVDLSQVIVNIKLEHPSISRITVDAPTDAVDQGRLAGSVMAHHTEELAL